MIREASFKMQNKVLKLHQYQYSETARLTRKMYRDDSQKQTADLFCMIILLNIIIKKIIQTKKENNKKKKQYRKGKKQKGK